MIIKSRQTWRAILVQTVMLVLGSIFTGFGVLASRIAFRENVFANYLGALFFGFIGISSLFIVFTTPQRIRIDTKKKIITAYRGWVFSTIYQMKFLTGYNRFTHRTKYNSYAGFLFETLNDKQIKFSRLDFKNIEELRDGLTQILPHNKSLRNNLRKLDALLPLILTGVTVSIIAVVVLAWKFVRI